MLYCAQKFLFSERSVPNVAFTSVDFAVLMQELAAAENTFFAALVVFVALMAVGFLSIGAYVAGQIAFAILDECKSLLFPIREQTYSTNEEELKPTPRENTHSETQEEEQEEFDEELPTSYLEKKALPKAPLLDLSRNIYPKKDISWEEFWFLQKNGFVMHKDNKFGKSGVSRYAVRVRNNESPKHAFLCYVVEKELRKAGFQVELQETRSPDIIAKKNGKTCAFEIETGTIWTRRPQEAIEQRFQAFARAFERPFIVVADRKQVHRYECFAPTITRSQLRGVIIQLLGENQNAKNLRENSAKKAEKGRK